jgi:hypothetical protein
MRYRWSRKRSPSFISMIFSTPHLTASSRTNNREGMTAAPPVVRGTPALSSNVAAIKTEAMIQLKPPRIAASVTVDTAPTFQFAGRRLRAVSLLVDLMHLVVILAGVGIGAWALIALRSRLPRGRYLAFGAASAGALFGCAALAGEVGWLSRAAWFAIVMAAMAGVALVAVRSSAPRTRTA